MAEKKVNTKKPKNSRKGNVGDIALIIVVMFSFALIVIIGKNVFVDLNEGMQDAGFMSNRSVSILDNFESNYTTIFDGIFLFVFVGLIVGVAISAFMIKSHPAFFFVTIILLAFFIIIAAIFSNVYEDISTNEAFVDQSADFTVINHIMGNLPVWITIGGALVLLALYIKSRAEEV